MNNSTTTQTPSTVETPDAAAHRRSIMKTLRKKHFCTLATTSPAGRPHSAGVVYEWADESLWIHAMRSSRKAKSVAANGYAAVTVPFRRLPAGPPFTIHFQGAAELVEMDDPEIAALVGAGKLKKISGHGALEATDGCFLRIRPKGTIHSYGPGASIIGLIRDPLNHGAGTVPFESIGNAS